VIYGGTGKLHAPAALPGEITHGVLWIGDWVDPGVGVQKRKISFHLKKLKSDSSAIQPVILHFTSAVI
jgi:hypothetical protein